MSYRQALPREAVPTTGLPAVEPLGDRAVWYYGLAVLLGHVLCFVFLARGSLELLMDAADPICWPFFEACHHMRFRSPGPVVAIGAVYLGTVLLAAAVWAARRPRLFLIALGAAAVELLGIVLLDYRMRQNQYYMFLWLNLTYLGVPRLARRKCLQVVIALFYYWAGLLKVNREWLSGAVLYRDLWLIPRPYAPIACGYVLVLELVLIWGLFARSTRVFWLTLAQLALFHIMSLSQITWFYPALMGAILSLYPLCELVSPRRRFWRLRELGRQERWALAVLTVSFSLCQVIPRLLPGDTALTGEGRVFALHMFEARQQCQVKVIYRRDDGTREERSILRSQYAPRFVCDTVVYYGVARNLCRALPAGTTNLDLMMISKRSTDRRWTTVIDAPEFCTRVHDFRVLGPNWWIRH